MISTIRFKERRQRKLQNILEPVKVQHLIKNYLVGRIYLLKHYLDKEPIRITKYRGENLIEVKTNKKLENQTVFYSVFKKYIEAICHVVQEIGKNSYLLDVKAFNIGVDIRESSRKNVTSEQIVGNNIRAARNVINTSLFDIPTSVKIHFQDYQAKIKGMADHTEVEIFDRADEKLELICRTGKILYLANTQEAASYVPEYLEGFVDYRRHLNVNLNDEMEKYKRNRIISELIVPIIYSDHLGKLIPLGYFRLLSKSEPIGIDVVMNLKLLAFEMVDRIRNSNTLLINKKQEIVNISHKGMLMKVTDEELKKFLTHQRGFSFDAVFKRQQPITLFTEIIYTAEIKDGPLLIGIQIDGHSSRKNEMKRYHESIDTLPKSLL